MHFVSDLFFWLFGPAVNDAFAYQFQLQSLLYCFDVLYKTGGKVFVGHLMPSKFGLFSFLVDDVKKYPFKVIAVHFLRPIAELGARNHTNLLQMGREAILRLLNFLLFFHRVPAAKRSQSLRLLLCRIKAIENFNAFHCRLIQLVRLQCRCILQILLDNAVRFQILGRATAGVGVPHRGRRHVGDVVTLVHLIAPQLVRPRIPADHCILLFGNLIF